MRLIAQDLRREGKLVTHGAVMKRLLQEKGKGRRVAARRPSGGDTDPA